MYCPKTCITAHPTPLQRLKYHGNGLLRSEHSGANSFLVVNARSESGSQVGLLSHQLTCMPATCRTRRLSPTATVWLALSTLRQ